ncbi:hypothetical protein K450DRAFT_240802 [Umbelopsis ramanniana AG]|uniref:BZIP domain-containing protein n=1 Tax=Umbelopsis ramanniana AG TaxID=1314678 RepID=A0AAD5HF38_UMBRA|nr:uncharacterized protein K450DRAFT_240802 [Umbelopsis ramanniana AG]KAI8579648.1 hypothetical protein K450DRAFT_240802 [Umbelopsis ramanniana AG]
MVAIISVKNGEQYGNTPIQPDTQAMRTLPPISSLAHQSDLTNRPKSILPATTPRITPILPHIVTTATTTSTYHPSSHEPVMNSLSYYPLHVTSTPHLPDGYAYDPTKSPPSHLDGKGGQLTSEQVLAEKRRRNAGASARFRDRRKQRERDMTDKCHQLEERVRELEIALSRATGQSVEEIQEGARKPLHQRRRSSSVYSDESQDKSDNFQTLGERVSELENLVGRSRREKDASVKQLQELEKENAYLRSLLTPATAPIAMAPSTPPMSVSSSPPTSSHKIVQQRSTIAVEESSSIEAKRRKFSHDAAEDITVESS